MSFDFIIFMLVFLFGFASFYMVSSFIYSGVEHKWLWKYLVEIEEVIKQDKHSYRVVGEDISVGYAIFYQKETTTQKHDTYETKKTRYYDITIDYIVVYKKKNKTEHKTTKIDDIYKETVY